MDRYRSLNGCIFMCFLDASKAFDRVQHSVLFAKLVRRGVPMYIVKLLCYWYSYQTMCVRWGGVLSGKLCVSNGVRQGGIPSPYLCNVYMDDLSTNLNTCNVGCLSGTMMVNHLMYADDLVIFCPSAIELRKLLEVCERYSTNHAILYNHKKSAVMIYRNEFTRNVVAPLFKVNDSIIPEVSHVKYLGHFISNDGRDDLDIMRQRRQLYVQGNMLTCRFHMCSLMLKILCSALSAPHCTQRICGAWHYSKCCIQQLYVAYNKSIMYIECCPNYPLSVVQVECLSAIMLLTVHP